MGDLLGSPRVAFPFLFFFKIYFIAVPSSYFLRVPRRHGPGEGEAEGEPVRRSHGRAGRGGAGIKGRRTQGMSDAIIPALKHLIPSELHS